MFISSKKKIPYVATDKDSNPLFLFQCLSGNVVKCFVGDEIPLIFFSKKIAKGKIFLVNQTDIMALEELMKKKGINIFRRYSTNPEIQEYLW